MNDIIENKPSSIVLAGGCFWGTQAYIRRLKGVLRTSCGYANGNTPNPDYKMVCTGKTGHAEAVRTEYDPDILPLEKLLSEYFKTINPTSVNRQGGDTGTQYRTGIYYSAESDKTTAETFIAKEQKKFGRPIAVEVLPLTCFYPAEEYHQDYLEKNPGGYCHVDLSLLPKGDE
ncbi:MAG: peptide-methionine (S)-S-oxide reductase MsrA [Treponema sp.]|nr:peptide-methionine (S)-S-oxide reductase MsrA [Treponema sp.]